MIHLEEQLSHDRGQRDFGSFALFAQMSIEFPEGALFHAGQADGSHEECAPHRRAAAANMSLTFPRSTLARPRGQPAQGRSLAAVELTQFGHLTEHADGGEQAHSVEFYKLVDLGLPVGGAGEGNGQLGFDGFNLAAEMPDLFVCFFAHERQRGVFAVVAGPVELFEQMESPLHQGAKFLQAGIGQRSRLRAQSGAKGGENGGIQWIVLGPLALSQSEVADLRRINHADEDLRGMQSGNDLALVAAAGFADDMSCGDGAQLFDQLPVAGSGIRKSMLLALKVKLEGGLLAISKPV